MRFRLWREHPVAALAVVVGAFVAVFNVIASYVVDHGWHSAGDPALDELLVRDVGWDHFPLVGSYSRFGWNHLGAWFFYVSSIPYRLSGGQAWTLKFTAALVALAALGWCVRAGWRVGKLVSFGPFTGAGIAAVSWLLFVAGGKGATIRFVWNVNIAQLLFLAMLWWLLAWALGASGSLMQVVLVGSLLMLMYVGYVPIVGLLILMGFGGRWWWHRRNSEGWVLWSGSTAERWSLAVVVGVWLPVLFDQVSARGNLGKVVEYLLSGNSRPLTSSGDAVALLSQQLDIFPDVFGHLDRSGAAIPVVFLFVIGLRIALCSKEYERGGMVGRWGLVTGFLMLLAARGELFEYRLLWLPVIGLFWLVLLMWGLLVAAEDVLSSEVTRRWLSAMSMVGMLVVGASGVVNLSSRDTGQFYASQSEMDEVLIAVRDAYGSGERVAVGRVDSAGAHDYVSALRVAAEKDGQEWCDPFEEPWLAGEHRLCGRKIPAAGVLVLGPDDAVPSALAGAEMVAGEKGRVVLVDGEDIRRWGVITDQ